MKKCPFCAEEIQDVAIKCKHCREFLDPSFRPAPVATTAPVSSADGVPWYCRPGFLVLTFVTVPPFALPLVWLHPKLHIVWKIVITLVIGLICWVMYRTFVAFTEQFEEATKMLQGMPF